MSAAARQRLLPDDATRATSALRRHAHAEGGARRVRARRARGCPRSTRRSCSTSPTRCCSRSIGAVALMLLTGYAGQISLGHAGLLAAGAFTVGILFKEVGAPFWVTLPAAARWSARLLGRRLRPAVSLRLRGLYLAVSTLALHFIVIYLGAEYETRRGFSTGVVIDPPQLGAWTLHRRARLVLRAARLRRGDGARRPQPAALAHRARLARDPRPRGGRRGARHQRARVQGRSRSW